MCDSACTLADATVGRRRRLAVGSLNALRLYLADYLVLVTLQSVIDSILN
jgi:hypothetical protein